MLSLLAAAVLFQTPSAPIERDTFGVPHVLASSLDQAFFHAGYAVAQDRLWQMEMSRRVSRGRMAEVMGAGSVNSDRDVLMTGYTDEELQQQFEGMSPKARQVMIAYAEGVNAWMKEATAAGKLPEGYAKNGFSPEPWTTLDSVAIAIRLYQTFGQGGAGELRNWALLMYLQARPNKEQALDVFDDFLWENDPASPTTVLASDDPLAKNPPKFPKRTRAATEKHLGLLPKATLGELLPAIRVASREEPTLIAQVNGVLYKSGSYAIVVAPQRSLSGRPMLLSAPQMGHETPSVVHEMSISCPEYQAVGMNVPGVPGIAIGYGPEIAWGLTSGVADTTDIFFSRLGDDGRYFYGQEQRGIKRIERTVKVKGGEPRTVAVQRTHMGPIIATSAAGKAIFSQASSWWMREMESYESMLEMPMAKSVEDVNRSLRHATVSFNAFFALKNGTVGYRYVGAVPRRAEGTDLRLPTPGEPGFEWNGMIPFEQMPHVTNPKSGLILNWNNKPVSWWPNMDTPTWGRLFRNETLNQTMVKPKFALSDLELAAWTIARRDANLLQIVSRGQAAVARSPFEKPEVESLRAAFAGFDGSMLDGSVPSRLAVGYFDALREELFMGTTGNFLNMNTFRTVAQASVTLQALEGKTKTNYLANRTRDQVQRAAFERMAGRVTDQVGYRPTQILVPGEPSIPYNNRGTFIQVVDFALGGPSGRSVNSPGVAESGPHSRDQAVLARQWTYKPMRIRN